MYRMYSEMRLIIKNLAQVFLCPVNCNFLKCKELYLLSHQFNFFFRPGATEEKCSVWKRHMKKILYFCTFTKNLEKLRKMGDGQYLIQYFIQFYTIFMSFKPLEKKSMIMIIHFVEYLSILVIMNYHMFLFKYYRKCYSEKIRTCSDSSWSQRIGQEIWDDHG